MVQKKLYIYIYIFFFNPEAIQNALQVKEINDYTFNSFPSVIFRSFDNSSVLNKERK